VADTARLVTTLHHRLGDEPEHVVIWDTVEITVGRAPGQDLVVPDGDVSREHTVFRRERASFVVEDRGTALGTRVNGQRVRTAALDPGDVIEVGRMRLEFRQSQRAPRAGGRVRYASELKADAPAPRGPGDRTMMGFEPDAELASPRPAVAAPVAAGARALSDDGALEEVPGIGDDLALPPDELASWCAAPAAARDLDLELGLAGAPGNEGKERDEPSDEDDPHATTIRDAGALAAAEAAPAAPAATEAALELAVELRGPAAGVAQVLSLLEAGELAVGPLRLRLRGAARRLISVSLVALGLGAAAPGAGAATLMKGSDFEAVDVSSLQLDPDSGQALAP
jgi:hypothetical protein